jgi:uncharacterized membrane protein
MNRWLYVSLTLAALALVFSLYVYANRGDMLEANVPTHWNLSGQPDVRTPRDSMLPHLLALPGVMVLFVVLTLVLPWLSPKQFGVDEFRDTFNYLMMLAVVMMAYLDAVFLTVSLHPDLATNGTLDIGRLMAAGIFPFIALLGNQLGKVRRNFWMGVRTPWTLASEPVWTQTHRLAAWVFVGVGVIGFVAALADVPLVLCFGLLIVGAFVPVIYSLVLYKRLEREGKL